MSGNRGAEDLRWFALRTVPAREKMTRDILRRFGLVAEIPTEKRLRRRTRKDPTRQSIRYCAAPGYCLVAFPADQPFPWRVAFRLHLVRSVVSVDGRPAELNHHAVFRFLNFEEADLPEYFKYFRTGDPEFRVGDTVQVHGDGIWRDRKLVVEDVRDGEAIFSLILFGKKQQIGVPISQCIKSQAA